MSIQLGMQHILASRPDRFATIAAINADARMLSGADWSRKLRQIAKRASLVNIFSDGLVERVAGGWRLTEAGWAFMASLDVLLPGGESAPTNLRLCRIPPYSRPAPKARVDA